jgi:hypothetical protein
MADTREAEHLLYSVRSEYGDGFGKGLWQLGAVEAARVARTQELSELVLPVPRAPRLLSGPMAEASRELAALGWIVPVHDARPTASFEFTRCGCVIPGPEVCPESYEHAMWRTGQRTEQGDGVILPRSLEKFREFQDFVPATVEGLLWMWRKHSFLLACRAAEERATNPLLAILASELFWEHSGVDEWAQILKLGCVCRATVRLVGDHRVWERVTLHMQHGWLVARDVLWMYGDGRRLSAKAGIRYRADVEAAMEALTDGRLSLEDWVAQTETHGREFARAVTETRARAPSRATAMWYAHWTLQRLGREALQRVMPCDFSLVAHLKGLNELFSPAAVYTRVLQWAPGGMTQALFLKRRSLNRYTMDAFQRSPEQMADLRIILAERLRPAWTGQWGGVPLLS